MMQYGKIGSPIVGFEAQKQILIAFLNSQYWEIPFNWDFGRSSDAIDPVQEITEGIKKYLDFTIDSVEIEGSRVTIYLQGQKINV